MGRMGGGVGEEYGELLVAGHRPIGGEEPRSRQVERTGNVTRARIQRLDLAAEALRCPGIKQCTPSWQGGSLVGGQGGQLPDLQ